MKNQPQASGHPVSTSNFYMWRCVIAIAHADGHFSDEERAYLQKIFSGMDRTFGLTEEQKNTFAADMVRPQKISELLPFINDPACRSQLIYFGGLLARADGVLHPTEDSILGKLHADQLSGLDMDRIRADVKKSLADELFRHELEKSALRPQSGFLALLDDFLLWLGIDIMD